MRHRNLRRRSAGLFWLCFLPIFVLTLWAWWRYGIQHEQEPQFHHNGSTEFNLSVAPGAEPATLAAEPVMTRFEQEAKLRLSGNGAAGPGLSGFVPESRPRAAAPGQSAGRQRELDFIKEYDPIIRREQGKLRKIIRSYRKKHEVVRRFDKDVQGMPRVMGLAREYAKDRDFYKWARNVVQLSEFRGLVAKYARDADAWKAGTGMILQALKTPPPTKVYTELLKLFTEDPVVARHTPEMMGNVLSNLPSMLMQSAQQGQDLAPLQGLASDLLPNSGVQIPLVDSSLSNRYWAGYKAGYEEGVRESSRRRKK